MRAGALAASTVCRLADYPGGDLNADPNGLVRRGATTRLNRFIDYYAKPPGRAQRAHRRTLVVRSGRISVDALGLRTPTARVGR